MIERDKEFYNHKISELYSIIDNQEKIIRELQEDLQDYERIFDIWNKRKLIKKFNKEFSKKMVKEERAKGNKIVGAIPDAEYVYKKYYEKVEQVDKVIDILNQPILNYAGCVKVLDEIEEILKGSDK
jgi:prefoldin subunit 5